MSVSSGLEIGQRLWSMGGIAAAIGVLLLALGVWRTRQNGTPLMSMLLAGGLSVAITLLVWFGYQTLGASHALRVSERVLALPTQPLAGSQREDVLSELLPELMRDINEVAKQNPSNYEWRLLLGQWQFQLRQYKACEATYTALLSTLTERDDTIRAEVLYRLAQAQFHANERRGRADMYAKLQQSLRINDSTATVQGLAGTVAFDLQRWAQALEHWQRLWHMLPSNKRSPVLRQAILHAGAQLNSQGTPVDLSWLDERAPSNGRLDNDQGGNISRNPNHDSHNASNNDQSQYSHTTHGVHVAVSFDSLDAQLPANAAVFIVARAPEGANTAPIAAVKLPASALPAHVLLTDQQAMLETLRISAHTRVSVSAWLSLDGEVSHKDTQADDVMTTVAVNAAEALPIELVLASPNTREH